MKSLVSVGMFFIGWLYLENLEINSLDNFLSDPLASHSLTIFLMYSIVLVLETFPSGSFVTSFNKLLMASVSVIALKCGSKRNIPAGISV